MEHDLLFKGKREYIANVKIPNLACPKLNLILKYHMILKKHAVVPDSIKITFNLYIESTNETCSIANNTGRTLVKKSGNAWIKGNSKTPMSMTPIRIFT